MKVIGGGGGGKKNRNTGQKEGGENATAGDEETERIPVDLSVYEREMEEFKVRWIYERLREDELETNV